MNNNLVPKQTVRSDGVLTTVHVNPDKGKGGKSAAKLNNAMGTPRSGSHDTLMSVGESREMPATKVKFGGISVERDEDAGIENVTVSVPLDQWGHERSYDDNEDRVAFLVTYDGVSGSAIRIPATAEKSGWGDQERYDYAIELYNPYTDETIEQTYSTGAAHTNTPTVDYVLGSMVADAATVVNTSSIEEWASELGYEPNFDPDDEDMEFDEDEEFTLSDSFDPWREHRATYDACVEINEKLQEFLGRRYDDYMWGNDDSSSLNVTFNTEN